MGRVQAVEDAYSTTMSSARSASGGFDGEPCPRTQWSTQWARSRVTEFWSLLNDETTVSEWKTTVLPSHLGIPSPCTTDVLSESTALVRKRMSRQSLLAAADTMSLAAFTVSMSSLGSSRACTGGCPWSCSRRWP